MQNPALLSTGLSQQGIQRPINNPLNSQGSNANFSSNDQMNQNAAGLGQRFKAKDPSLEQAQAKMKRLGTLKQKLEKIFNDKYSEFKERINKSLKEKFDAELKRALFHLWKHYKNCLENPNREQCAEQLREHMQKIHNESAQFRMKYDQQKGEELAAEEATENILSKLIKDENNGQVDEFSNFYNKDGISDKNPEDRRRELESRINQNTKETEKINEKMRQIEASRTQNVYEIKLKMEKEGRDEMEEKSRELLMASVNTQIPEIGQIREEVKSLKYNYEETKDRWLRSGAGPDIGEQEIKRLEKELYELLKNKNRDHSASRSTNLRYH